jgi:hypothetical protein
MQNRVRVAATFFASWRDILPNHESLDTTPGAARRRFGSSQIDPRHGNVASGK